MWGSVVAAHGLSSRGSRAEWLHAMRNLPGPGIVPCAGRRILIQCTPGVSCETVLAPSFSETSVLGGHARIFPLCYFQ